MGAPKTGPTAKKRPEDRLGHRTKAELSKTVTISPRPDAGDVVVPVPDADWHRAARQVWDAFVDSPIAHLWESSDYAQAWVTCAALSICAREGYSAAKLKEVRQMMNDLMLTEMARRTADIQIERTEEQSTDAEVRAIETARSRQHGA